MGKFGKDKRKGGKKDDNIKHGSASDKPQLFNATCATCGNSCQVPFKPNGSKPVLCRGCFSSSEGGFKKPERNSYGNTYDPSRRFSPESQDQNYKREFKKLNQKLDEILRRLPSADINETDNDK